MLPGAAYHTNLRLPVPVQAVGSEPVVDGGAAVTAWAGHLCPDGAEPVLVHHHPHPDRHPVTVRHDGYGRVPCFPLSTDRSISQLQQTEGTTDVAAK